MDLDEGEHEGDLMAKCKNCGAEKSRDSRKERCYNCEAKKASTKNKKKRRADLREARRKAGFIDPKTGKSNGKGKGIDMAHSRFYGKGKVTPQPSSENKSRQPKRNKRTKTA